MTSHLVTIVTDYYCTCLKMCAKDKRTATEKKQLGKKSEKPYEGLATTDPPFPNSEG